MKQAILDLAESLSFCSQRGLVERFDGSIGAGSVFMPFGGRFERTPTQVMAALFPVLNGETADCSVMSFGFNPYLSESDPFRGAACAVVESLAKLTAAGCDTTQAYLTLQEYFERLREDPERWGKPLAALLGVMAVIALAAYLLWHKETCLAPTQQNPAQLKTALVFACIYALIKLAVSAARQNLGEPGLYLVSVISGLTDMDAVTLSTARLVDSGKLEALLGWRTILIAAISNLAFKAGAVAIFGGSVIFHRVAALFALSGIAGGLILALWR
jgi:hypothetical protein